MVAMGAWLLVGMLSGLVSSPEAADPAEALVGTPAPEFEAVEGWIHTPALEIADLRGKLVILEYFSPELYATSYRGSVARLNAMLPVLQRNGCVLLAVSLDVMADLEDFAARSGARFAMASDASRENYRRYQVGALGRSFLIDSQGVVRWTGFADRERKIWMREIEKLSAGEEDVAPPARRKGRSRLTPRSSRKAPGLAGLPFERSLDRAERSAREERRPILVIVTGGQDPADRDLARVIYRDPGVRRLAKKFVLLPASPDRHEEDRVTQGGVTRGICSYFGELSCREHQANEARVRDLLFQEHGLVLTPQHLILAGDRVLASRAGRVSKTQLIRFLSGGLREFRARKGRADRHRAAAAGA